MKKFLLILVFGMLLQNCQHLKYLNAFDGYKGEPKIVESQFYEVEVEGEKITEVLSTIDVFHFDDDGRIVKWLDFFGPDKKPAGAGWHYEYDKKGNITEFYLYQLDSTVQNIIHYSHNKYGQIIEEKSNNFIKKITYDRQNRHAELISRDRNGKFHNKTRWKYDKQWREVELADYDSLDNLTARIEFVYDGKGCRTETRWFNSQNKLSTIYKLAYNGKRDPINKQTHKIKDKDTLITNQRSFEYTYDSKGNVIEEKQFANGKITYITRNIISY